MTMLGKTPWNKGITFPYSKEWEDKRIAAVKEASKKRIYAKGYKRPAEHTMPMREAIKKWRLENPEKARELSIHNLPKNNSGPKNGNWRGGVTKIARDFRTQMSTKFSKWREIILERDGHKCRECGSNKKLEVNHIVPLSESHASAFLRMNGVTLCHKCHVKTDSYGCKSWNKHGNLGRRMVAIKTISHSWQDYPTCGNWAFDEEGCLLLFISQMSDWRYEFLVAFHELVEAMICKCRGVSQEDVDNFDIMFEEERKAGKHSEDDEPGDDLRAPYKDGHFMATNLEAIAAFCLGVNWKSYENEVYSL